MIEEDDRRNKLTMLTTLWNGLNFDCTFRRTCYCITMCNVLRANALALAFAVDNNGVSHFAVFTIISLRDQRINRAKWLRVRYAGQHYGAMYVRSMRRQDARVRACTSATHTQRGCWPAHFWMTLLRMRYLLSTPRDRPPPFPRNWLHASFHAIYSRSDRPLFILV